mmetsp:Transcript_2510/g.8763  ORF Transcript_2510/g.8763 Transcript_2510/m.8763 type:complete len:304 (+) Transcript_2510:4769-5680(+)
MTLCNARCATIETVTRPIGTSFLSRTSTLSSTTSPFLKMSLSFISKNPTSSKSIPLSSETRQNGIVASSGLFPLSKLASAKRSPESVTGNAFWYPKSTNCDSLRTRAVCCSSSRWNLGMNSKSMNICRTLWSWYSVFPSSNWPIETTIASSLGADEVDAPTDARAPAFALETLTLIIGDGDGARTNTVSSSISSLIRGGSAAMISETRAAPLAPTIADADVTASGSFHATTTKTVPRSSRVCENNGNEPLTASPFESGAKSTRAIPITPAPSKSTSASSNAMISIADLAIPASTSGVRRNGKS